jgi:hypothetical protein
LAGRAIITYRFYDHILATSAHDRKFALVLARFAAIHIRPRAAVNPAMNPDITVKFCPIFLILEFHAVLFSARYSASA